MQKEKVRIYALARELDIESKDLIDLCRQAGIEVKNQLSSLDPEQRDAVELMVKRGGGTAVAAPPKPASALPPLHTPVPLLQPTKPPVLSSRPALRREPEPLKPVTPSVPTVDTPEPVGPVTPPVVHEAPPTRQPSALPMSAPAAKVPETMPAAAARAPEPTMTPRPPETTPPPATSDAGGRAPDAGSKPPSPTGTNAPRMRDLSQPRPDAGQRPQRKREIPRGVHRGLVATPPPLKQRPMEERKKPQEPVAQKPIAYVPPDVAKAGGPINVSDLMKKGGTPAIPGAIDVDVEDEEGGDSAKGKVRPGGVAGRDKRHQQRNERAKQRKGRSDVEVVGGRVLMLDDDRPQRTKDRLNRAKKQQRGPTQPRKGKVPVDLPITVRSLSEAIGLPSVALMFKLKDLGIVATNLNVMLTPETAEAIALEHGCELDIKRGADAEVDLLAGLEKPDNPEDLVPRAPIVTIMGHVDHGKTSLLDKIRKSNVVATEAGGITQVIRAWRVDHGGRPITFLDTPGHEAFTKMRARGAHVTDIAVIVVAADDGVMPQTEEAINHAKAAGVSMVVAINKVDLPNANLNRTRQQLYGLNVLPDNMGGDVPFVETSAATGKGIFDENGLLDMMSVVAELKELKANPNKAARGTCLEAMLSEGEGVFATLLVQDGTLHKGDVILCGASYGRVRAMYDDLGRPIQEAGPTVPVRITGLDEVPNADDPFNVVPDLATAREIGEKRKAKHQEASIVRREPVRLENLSAIKIVELKVILKADFRGSIEAIRKELEKLHHAEVRVRVLEAAIGAITENDVWLALTSPEDTLIVGFNAVPDDRARALAEEKGVQIREYDIIYKLTDDIRSALEGKLKPREEVVHLGRAVVRETFKISRVGTVAGCYVTQGTIERSAKVRVIREGVVIYPPADRTAGLDSLKRFKEDVREVREGFECGIKIVGYDDLKVGDVIEAYRVEHIQRTLEK